MKNRLRQLLAQQQRTQTWLADEVGVAKGFISEIASGKKAPSFATQQAIAEALQVPLGAIWDTARPIPIVGYVGAGAEVELLEPFAKGGGYYYIAGPSDLATDGLVGVEAKGESMSPLIEDEDILLFSRRVDGIDPAAVGRVAICGLANGRALIKQIKPGRDPGRFDLYSINDGFAPMYGCEVRFAAPYRRHLRREDVLVLEP